MYDNNYTLSTASYGGAQCAEKQVQPGAALACTHEHLQLYQSPSGAASGHHTNPLVNIVIAN